MESGLSNASAFGLSKDLKVPMTVKLCYLQPSNPIEAAKTLAKPSQKYEYPQVFKKLSNVYFNSDLFVTVEVVSGKSNNALTLPTGSMYHSFTNNKRVWNQYLQLPINYNQLPQDSFLKFRLYEVVDSRSVVFGTGCMSVFNHRDSTLRKGIQKIVVNTDSDREQEVNYYDTDDIDEVEMKLIKYQNGEFCKIEWLDKLSLPIVERKRDEELKTRKSNDFFLYIELPKFDLPIVYSDISYPIPDTSKITKEFIEARNKNNPVGDTSTNLVVNKIEISSSSKVFDPDFHLTNLNVLVQSSNTPANGAGGNSGGVMGIGSTGPALVYDLDPIESKYHKLERNMNNSTLLDKELKPTPQLRDELLTILDKPSNIDLTDVEKNLIWKFRYYFSKNNSNATSDNKPEVSKVTQKFLTKFLKSINWDNDYELDHTFNEILPNYWSVDKIRIGDALELLSSYFNPFTLVKNLDPNQQSQKIDSTEESKVDKVFRYVRQLREFAVNRLRLASGDELLLYLLQLVQALKYESLIVDTEINTVDGDVDGRMDDIISNRKPNTDDPSKEAESRLLEKSPLASFLIEKSVENEKLGNYFYWYVKVENEDQLNTNGVNSIKIYSIVLNKYISELKNYSNKHKSSHYNHLKRQVWFIKKLTGLVELLRTTFKKNEATAKKVQFLREYLADSSNEFLKFPHSFPLPLDPSVMICGCYPEESSVFKSSLAPLKLTFKTVIKEGHNNQIFGDRKKYGKYTLMFKIGDDLRQDQLVIQIIDLMDQLLKNENLDLKLTPYRILATSPIAGMIQFVPNETLDSILAKNWGNDPAAGNTTNGTVANNNGILNFLRLHSQEYQPEEPVAASVLGKADLTAAEQPSNQRQVEQHAVTSDLGVASNVMDNYVKSCAGYCVITYLLGVGDRHLDNLLLSSNGKFWHADFGYILGRDPKPFPPLMKLPIQVIDGMGGLNHENFNVFQNYCFVTYTTLRKNSNLILNLFQLMLDANIPDIQMDPTRAVEKVQEKFCLQMSEEEAILHFQNLINDSVNAFLPVVIDRLHSLAQYWRA